MGIARRGISGGYIFALCIQFPDKIEAGGLAPEGHVVCPNRAYYTFKMASFRTQLRQALQVLNGAPCEDCGAPLFGSTEVHCVGCYLAAQPLQALWRGYSYRKKRAAALQALERQWEEHDVQYRLAAESQTLACYLCKNNPSFDPEKSFYYTSMLVWGRLIEEAENEMFALGWKRPPVQPLRRDLLQASLRFTVFYYTGVRL